MPDMKTPTTSRLIYDPKTTIVVPVTLYDDQGLFFSQFETRVGVGQFFDVAKDKYEAICQMLAEEMLQEHATQP